MSHTMQLLRVGVKPAGDMSLPPPLAHLEFPKKLVCSALFVTLFSIQLKTTKVPVVPKGLPLEANSGGLGSVEAALRRHLAR